MKKLILLFSLIMIFLSCQLEQQTVVPAEANCRTIDYYCSGSIEYDIFSFCAIVPYENAYIYKVGSWKFWDMDAKLIAAGKFDIETIEILDRGGCTYQVKESKIDFDKWTFYEAEKLSIEERNQLVLTLETCRVGFLYKQ